MARHFLDSSPLVKRYRDEAGSGWMIELSWSSAQLTVARLAQIEVTSAIVRRGREGDRLSAESSDALRRFEREFEEIFEVVELEGSVMPVAVSLARSHGLGAADAIQLSCALLVAPPGSTDFSLVSADDELNAAAQLEGLRVDNPNHRR